MQTPPRSSIDGWMEASTHNTTNTDRHTTALDHHSFHCSPCAQVCLTAHGATLSLLLQYPHLACNIRYYSLPPALPPPYSLECRDRRANSFKPIAPFRVPIVEIVGQRSPNAGQTRSYNIVKLIKSFAITLRVSSNALRSGKIEAPYCPGFQLSVFMMPNSVLL